MFLFLGCFLYAIFTVRIEQKGVLNIIIGNLYSYLTGDAFDSQHRVTVAAGKTQYFYITLENINNVDAKVNLYYQKEEAWLDQVTIGYVENVASAAPGEDGIVLTKYQSSNSKNQILLYIRNNCDPSITISFGSSIGLSKADLPVPDGMVLITDKISSTKEDCFTVDSSIKTITGYLCVEGNSDGLPIISQVVIPKNVMSIALGSFSNNQLTSVIIEGKSSFADFTR